MRASVGLLAVPLRARLASATYDWRLSSPDLDPPPAIEDWGQLISFTPELVLRPTSVDELKSVLEQIHRGELGNGRVRVPGSLHSCSKIVVSETILDVSALPKAIDFDAYDAAVEASANVALHEFLAELGRHGKSVTATGGTDHQTLAGLISTGTAPASSRHALYELLEWVELVRVDEATGRAVEQRISRGDPGFSAAVCSLGLLGVLTRVRFRLVDERHFNVVQKMVRLNDVLADLDSTSADYDFWRVNWVPKSDKALLWAAREVASDQSEPDGDYPTDSAEHLLDFVFQVLDKLTGSGSLLTGVLDPLYDVLAASYDERNFTGPLRNMLPVDRRAPLHVAMAEWSFRPTDVHRVIGECRDYFDDRGWPNIPTEIELSAVDGSLMSPWNWEGLPYVVKFNFMYLTEVCRAPGEKEAIYAHLRGLWEHLEAEGIPFKAHWGKINFMDPEFVRRNHAFDAFEPMISPMFMNAYLTERIGPV
jgi:D-arabinono-1,4-lactone oxidase/FAD binding domain